MQTHEKPVELNTRQEKMLELVRQRGFVSVEDFARHFEVTAQTIRRDINELCEAGMLRRYHGGAGLPSSVENVEYSTRQVMHLEEKRRIARLLASHIPNQASLFITLGTTPEEVAKALTGHAGLRIITNNLNVAMILSDNPSFEVIVAGGVVRHRDRGITGEATIDFIRQFKVDFGIIGISGIDAQGALLDFDYHEVRVQKAIIENSRSVYLAADHSKFGRDALVRLGDLSDVDALFTDAPPPRAIRSVLQEFGHAVIVAEPDQA